MKEYTSLFRIDKEQSQDSVFAHFYPARKEADTPDYDEPFKAIARLTIDGFECWTFQQERFRKKHALSQVPKLRKAFGCEKGQPMSPENSCRVW